MVECLKVKLHEGNNCCSEGIEELKDNWKMKRNILK
jgi:hypothetical protein